MSKEDKIVFCTGGGCTAKLGAGVLSRILEKLPRGEKDPDLLVGYDSRDDAAVYRITDDIALASPSGGQSGMPASKFPDMSRSAAPSFVRTPALSPAGRTCGRTSSTSRIPRYKS